MAHIKEFTKKADGYWYAPAKDPDAILDYTLDWEDWLEGDTILTSAWTVDTGITKASDSKTASTTVIWLSGGSAGETYTIHDRITTDAGRTADQTFKIEVKEQ